MSPTDLDLRIWSVLKSHDRIGFGRLGVLDAEPEIRRLAASLAANEEAQLRLRILSWLDGEEAERISSRLHYNLPEHVQALAIRLCASLPIPESLPRLRRMREADAFEPGEDSICRESLREALLRLTGHGGGNPGQEAGWAPSASEPVTRYSK